MKQKHLLRLFAVMVCMTLGRVVAIAQEAYAALSEDNTVLTFYYDENKESRSGMGVGPFSSATQQEWKDFRESITC